MNTNNIEFFNQGAHTMIIWLYMCFILCNFGQDVTSHYSDLTNEIYNLSWQLYALEMRHSMILNSQQSIYIEGFGKRHCTRDTFKKVIFLKICSTKSKFEYYSHLFIRLSMLPFRISWFCVVSTDCCNRFRNGYNSTLEHFELHNT